MALKLRLQRRGTKNAPTYNLVVAESSSPRDGKFVESLGSYNPEARGNDFEYKLKLDRIEYWLGVGAQPSNTAKTLIKRARKQTKNEDGEAIQIAAATA
ncbi:MAG: 30S ribosomal protein S16 [Verrucomicrobia bacterium]|nr:MAG: 30S ribosomal protein S16 [Verrucomicrobiota bacterium]